MVRVRTLDAELERALREATHLMGEFARNPPPGLSDSDRAALEAANDLREITPLRPWAAQVGEDALETMLRQAKDTVARLQKLKLATEKVYVVLAEATQRESKERGPGLFLLPPEVDAALRAALNQATAGLAWWKPHLKNLREIQREARRGQARRR